MRQYLLSIPMILLLLVGSTSAATVGQPIADFSLQDLDGNTHSTSDYRGKVIVLAAFGWS
ncbi:MAG: redoxin domain-containing protein [Candidatus Latescibacteria bacterium]|nr:redoxin domain-containing protein [Candidatus Latescibacterota bacterium]